jgi:hypothetical protein
VAHEIDLYDSHYGQLSTDAQAEVRRETYGEDLGQANWITAAEAREWFDLLQLGPGQHALEVACGSGGVTCPSMRCSATIPSTTCPTVWQCCRTGIEFSVLPDVFCSRTRLWSPVNSRTRRFGLKLYRIFSLHSNRPQRASAGTGGIQGSAGPGYDRCCGIRIAQVARGSCEEARTDHRPRRRRRLRRAAAFSECGIRALEQAAPFTVRIFGGEEGRRLLEDCSNCLIPSRRRLKRQARRLHPDVRR